MNDMKTKTNPTPPQLYRKLDRARRTAERAVTKMMGKEQGETHAGVVVWDRRIHAYFGFKPTPTTSLFGNDPELSEQAFVNAIRLAEINLSAAVNGLGSMNRDFESWLRTRQEDQQTVEAFTRQFKVPVVLDFSSDNNPLEFLALAWDLSDEDFHKQKFDPKQWASRAREEALKCFAAHSRVWTRVYIRRAFGFNVFVVYRAEAPDQRDAIQKKRASIAEWAERLRSQGIAKAGRKQPSPAAAAFMKMTRAALKLESKKLKYLEQQLARLDLEAQKAGHPPAWLHG